LPQEPPDDKSEIAFLLDNILLEAWNQKPGRTQGEVRALVDSAIARVRGAR
jgi:hypothetical protein